MAHWSSQTRNYAEALQWYNYSLSFFKAGQLDPNLAKLQRNRVSCFLQLKQLEKVRRDRPSQPGRRVFPWSQRCSVFIRPKMRLKKHRGLIPTAFLPTSASTRSQCWKTTQREVCGGHSLEEYPYLTLVSCESGFITACSCLSWRGAQSNGTSVQSSCVQRGQAAGV